ncbi:glucose-1-phosphate cytidylyltransferase [Candidatus Kaiserbacteria bacterium]|nr:glucose-1-phosphate cytidylyltransferase [Candidatus Kaiserbacteria bacterium]
MPVVIMCGGRGTRLKEETEFIPKPMVRIGDRPILWHIMKIYYAQGFRKFILPLGYKGEKIREYINNYSLYANDFTLKHGASKTTLTYHGRPAEGWQVSCIDTGLDTQTGGRIKRLEHFIKSPTFMLTYGDGVADVDLGKLLAEHTKRKRLATMTAVHPPVRFGEVILKKDGSVQAFSEKPVHTESNMRETLINGGFFAIDSKIFKRMSDDDALVFEKDVLTRLAKDGELVAVPHHGFWQCMDTIRDTEVLNDAWKGGSAPWKLWA